MFNLSFVFSSYRKRWQRRYAIKQTNKKRPRSRHSLWAPWQIIIFKTLKTKNCFTQTCVSGFLSITGKGPLTYHTFSDGGNVRTQRFLLTVIMVLWCHYYMTLCWSYNSTSLLYALPFFLCMFVYVWPFIHDFIYSVESCFDEWKFVFYFMSMFL